MRITNLPLKGLKTTVFRLPRLTAHETCQGEIVALRMQTFTNGRDVSPLRPRFKARWSGETPRVHQFSNLQPS